MNKKEAERIYANSFQRHSPYEMLDAEEILAKGFLEGYAEAEKDVLQKVISIIDNYPDITVDDSVRIKNEVYESFQKYREEV